MEISRREARVGRVWSENGDSHTEDAGRPLGEEAICDSHRFSAWVEREKEGCMGGTFEAGLRAVLRVYSRRRSE